MSTTTAAPATAAPAATPNATAQPQGSASSAAAGSAGKTPETAAQRTMRLKIEGQELELPESEVIALAQQGKQSGKKFQEAAAMRKQAEDILKFATENPAEFFKRTGKNARQWAEEYLVGELKRDQETPEQRKARENEEKLAKYEREAKEREESDRKEQLEALEQKHLKNYNEMFIQALEQSGLPKTPFTVKRMAELQLINVKKKLDLDAGQLAKIVREDYINEQRALFGSADGNALMDLLGPDAVKKLSKAQIAKLKAGAQKFATPDARTAAPKKTEKGMSWKDIQRRNLGFK